MKLTLQPSSAQKRRRRWLRPDRFITTRVMPRSRRHICLSEDRTLLEVRFRYDEALKDAIKRIPGASWAPERRIWTMEAHHASELLHIVREHGFDVDDEVKALAARGGNNARMRQLRRASRTDSLTPVLLNSRMAQVVRAEFSERFWIIGQISNWKDQGYFELIEKYADERAHRASINAFIAVPDYQHIDRLLSEMRPPLRWTNNLKVRLKGMLSFRERRGDVQLRIVDIDPHYTITLMNAAREEALQVLDEEGLSERNLSMPLPAVPLRVALLTSAGSDAAHDFIEELRESGLGFQVDLYDVRVSGPCQERTMLRALRHTAQHSQAYDVLVIVRGGGSRSDLSGFDLLSLGRAVCTHTLPVVCGIGHDRDHSLLDDVARSMKTPTKAAAALVEEVRLYTAELRHVQEQIGSLAGTRAREASDALSAMARQVAGIACHQLQLADRDLHDIELDIRRSGASRMAREQARLERLAQELPGRWGRRRHRELREVGHLERQLSPKRLLGDLRREGALLDAAEDRLRRSVQVRLRAARSTLAALAARREAADPDRVVERGFAIVTRPDGSLVRDARAVAPGTGLVVRLGSSQMNVTRDAEGAGHE